jgi:hypothetical protein
MEARLIGGHDMAMDIKEIEAAIAQLAPEDVVELLEWLEGYHAQLWDKQIESDLDFGRLDSTLAEVYAEYEAGRAIAIVTTSRADRNA